MKKIFLICAVALLAVACGNKVDSLLDKLEKCKEKIENASSSEERAKLAKEALDLSKEIQELNEDDFTPEQKERYKKIFD